MPEEKKKIGGRGIYDYGDGFRVIRPQGGVGRELCETYGSGYDSQDTRQNGKRQKVSLPRIFGINFND